MAKVKRVKEESRVVDNGHLSITNEGDDAG
jgi:hypothetical protein